MDHAQIPLRRGVGLLAPSRPNPRPLWVCRRREAAEIQTVPSQCCRRQTGYPAVCFWVTSHSRHRTMHVHKQGPSRSNPLLPSLLYKSIPVAGQQCAVICQARYSRAPRWRAMRTSAPPCSLERQMMSSAEQTERIITSVEGNSYLCFHLCVCLLLQDLSSRSVFTSVLLSQLAGLLLCRARSKGPEERSARRPGLGTREARQSHAQGVC